MDQPDRGRHRIDNDDYELSIDYGEKGRMIHIAVPALLIHYGIVEFTVNSKKAMNRLRELFLAASGSHNEGSRNLVFTELLAGSSSASKLLT